VTEEDVRMVAQGLKVDGEFTAMPARLCRDVTEDRKLTALLPDDHSALFPSEITQYSQIFVTITEGKYHQIKRMFAAIGKEVLYLKRLSMGPLYLDPALAPGQFRPLTREEIDMLVTRS
jgi:16S rRNA pseudouridine516 synthase